MEYEFLDDDMLQDLAKIVQKKPDHESFLQFHEMNVGNHILSNEYKIIADDVKKLASMDEKPLSDSIKAIVKELEMQPEFSDSDVKESVDRIRRFKDEDFSEQVDIHTLSLISRILTIDYEKVLSGQDLMDKNIALIRFLLTHDLRPKISFLRNNSEFQQIPVNLLNAIRDVAIDESLHHMLGTLRNNQLHEIVYSIRASLFQKKRWANWEKGKLYEDALKYAENQWANKGSQLMRNQMAEHITIDEKLIEEKGYDELNYEKLRDMLGPIAEKYDKLPKRGRPRKKSQ